MNQLEELLTVYQTRRSTLIGKMFTNLLEHDSAGRDVATMTTKILSRICLLEKRMESIRRVRDVEQPDATAPVADTLTTKNTLLRSLSLHAQLLTRTSYEAEVNGYDEQIMHQLTAHLRAINEVFYLFEVSSKC